MKIKVGINGMGRIGRMIIRSVIENNFKNIEIKDAKAFQRNAPKTEDFYNVVERSRPDIHRVLDERLKNNQWPFQFDGKWNQEEHEYKTERLIVIIINLEI